MKQEVLDELELFEKRLRELRREVKRLKTDRVGRQVHRELAEAIATQWVEKVRSPLEHQFELPRDEIQRMAALMKRLHVLSRPSNRRLSYLDVLDDALAGFKDRFVLPVQQTAIGVETAFDLRRLVTGLRDANESDYLTEAVECANAGYFRASVVMGWCAAIDRIQRKIQQIGFAEFNDTSESLKAQKRGRFKRFNKRFSITTLAGLQAVFDRDLITMLEGMELLDGNQADRLRIDFDYRNSAAHPGLAPLEESHAVAFFADIVGIVLTNPRFDVA